MDGSRSPSIQEQDLWVYDWLPFPVWAYDLNSQKMRYANPEALILWNSPSMKEFLERDFAVSATVRQRNQTSLERAAAGDVVTEHWTFYPRGEAIQTIATIGCFQFKDTTMGMLVTAVKMCEATGVDKSTLRGVEAIRHTQVKIAMFDSHGDILMSNPSTAKLRHTKNIIETFEEESAKENFRAKMKLSLTNKMTEIARVLQRSSTSTDAASTQMEKSRKFGDSSDIELTKGGKRAVAQSRDARTGDEGDSSHMLDAVVFSGEYQLACRDAASRWHSIAVRKCLDPVTGEVVFLFQAVDVDERIEARKAESRMKESLQHSEHSFHTLYQDAHEIIMLLDTKLRVLDVNSSAMRLLGIQQKELLLGTSWTDIFVDGERIRQLLKAEEESTQFECTTALRYTGSPLLCQISASKIQKSCQKLVLIVARDITKQKELETQLIQARTEAERLLNVKTQFLAAMSHELRTPLMGIMGSLDIISGRKEVPKWLSNFLNIIRLSGEMMLGIVNNILDLSRLEAGRMPISSTVAAVREIVEDIIQIMTPTACKKGLALKTEWKGLGNVCVMVDVKKLKQVLLNLIGNAVKFTEEGGVTVTTEISNDMGTTGKYHVILKIRDSGIGIKKEFIPFLFQHFSQGDASTVRKYGGSGLGLAVSKNLIEAIGGKILVTSEEGHGSEFSVEIFLPSAHKDTQQVDSSANSPLQDAQRSFPQASKLQILVAEDNKINQAVIRSLLQQLGHYPTIVADGLQAVSAVQERDFDVVLMDWMMPECDGLEATRRIRKLGKMLPIFAVTANFFPGDDKLCAASGMNGVITKPTTKASLRQILENLEKYPLHLSTSSDLTTLESRS